MKRYLIFFVTLLISCSFLIADEDYRYLKGVWKFSYRLHGYTKFTDVIEITAVSFNGGIEAQNYKTERKIKGYVRNDIVLFFEKEDIGNQSWTKGLEGYFFHVEKNKKGRIKIKYGKHIFIRNVYILFEGWQDELTTTWDGMKTRKVEDMTELNNIEKITEELDNYLKFQAIFEQISNEEKKKGE